MMDQGLYVVIKSLSLRRNLGQVHVTDVPQYVYLPLNEYIFYFKIRTQFLVYCIEISLYQSAVFHQLQALKKVWIV